MKNILFDKKRDAEEKMQALDKIVEKSKSVKLNFKSKSEILSAYVKIFESKFNNIIESNPNLKKAFTEIPKLIERSDNLSGTDKFFAVFNFVFTAVFAVCSLGLIFGIDRLMGNNDSKNILRSPFKFVKKGRFEELIKRLEGLKKEISNLSNSRKNIDKDRA